MPKFKNITIKKKGGGKRTQRVQVLSSGKYKFVKNKTKRKTTTRKRRTTRKGDLTLKRTKAYTKSKRKVRKKRNTNKADSAWNF